MVWSMCNLLRNKPSYDEAPAAFEELRDVRIFPSVPHFKIAPSHAAPVLTMGCDGKAKAGMMHFGFKTGKGGRQLMARGETVAELRMFRDAFKHRRCLVLAHGFYDSEDMGKYKQPWHLHLKTDGMMAFASLWEETSDAENFTIVSAPANAVVARVIDRMPVILPRELWRPWLEPATPREVLEPMLQPYPAELMEACPVTRKVNQPGFDGPECVERIVPEQGDLGLF
jgi:putative SOS response-associated peptidase YedK